MVETIVIDGPRALALVEQAVVERGEDFIYTKRPLNDAPFGIKTGCLYTYEGKPDCIVGYALHLAGVPVEHLNCGQDNLMAGAFCAMLQKEHGCYRISRHAAIVFQAAQQAQDNGSSWGQALLRAQYALRGVVLA